MYDPCADTCSRVSSVNPREGLTGLYLKKLPNKMKEKKLPNCSPKWFYSFTFPLAVYESSNCSVSWPALGMVSLFNFGYSVNI